MRKVIWEIGRDTLRPISQASSAPGGGAEPATGNQKLAGVLDQFGGHPALLAARHAEALADPGAVCSSIAPPALMRSALRRVQLADGGRKVIERRRLIGEILLQRRDQALQMRRLDAADLRLAVGDRRQAHSRIASGTLLAVRRELGHRHSAASRRAPHRPWRRRAAAGAAAPAGWRAPR